MNIAQKAVNALDSQVKSNEVKIGCSREECTNKRYFLPQSANDLDETHSEQKELARHRHPLRSRSRSLLSLDNSKIEIGKGDEFPVARRY